MAYNKALMLFLSLNELFFKNKKQRKLF